MAEPGAIAVTQLARLSGLTDLRLRELAAEGWFPRPVEGNYPLAPTIQGLLRYYRERDSNRLIQDAYDTIGSCAAVTGIPLTVLRHAKRQGCPAFRGSRVHLAPLLRWLFENPNRSPVNYEQERAQQVALQNAKLKVQVRQLKAELIPVEEVRHVGAELGEAIRKVLTRMPRIAPSLAGQAVEVIETRLKEEVDDALKQLHTLDEHLTAWQQSD